MNAHDERTKAALLQSIEKWKHNAQAEHPSAYKTASKDCPLCDIFQKGAVLEERDTCAGCPVKKVTGKWGCRNTPYGKAHQAGWLWKFYEGKSELKKWRLRRSAQFHARREVKFLERVLKDVFG